MGLAMRRAKPPPWASVSTCAKIFAVGVGPTKAGQWSRQQEGLEAQRPESYSQLSS